RMWLAPRHRLGARPCPSRGLACAHPNRVQLDVYRTLYFSLMVYSEFESHEQDGEKLSRVTAMRRATASGDPAMAFRTLLCRKSDPYRLLPNCRPRLSLPAQSSKRVHALLCEARRAHRPRAKQIIGGYRTVSSSTC